PAPTSMTCPVSPASSVSRRADIPPASIAWLSQGKTWAKTGLLTLAGRLAGPVPTGRSWRVVLVTGDSSCDGDLWLRARLVWGGVRCRDTGQRGRGGIPGERAGRQVPLGHQPVKPGGEQPGRQRRVRIGRPFPGADSGRDQLLQLLVASRVAGPDGVGDGRLV